MRRPEIYSTKQKAWGILMFLALLWLTVSLPYVYNAKQLIAKQSVEVAMPEENPVETAEDTTNPLSSSVEEKVPSNSSILEEYLHHNDEGFSANNPRLSHIDHRTYNLLVFHGELLSPPPESLLS
ncbi:MAG: hypothetical protein JNK79_18425 [Chitinophagaceae bacterium]|nr:hypothetical protein [Chitinophagaceae bacterium]